MELIRIIHKKNIWKNVITFEYDCLPVCIIEIYKKKNNNKLFPVLCDNNIFLPCIH